MKKLIAVAMAILIVFLCSVHAYAYGNPKYMICYFHGKNGWPSYYFDVRNRYRYIRVKVRGKYVYAALYNNRGHHLQYNGILIEKK